MTRELFGQLLGWVIITVVAWFVALAIMGYGLGSLFPWEWTIKQRFAHLTIQMVLLSLYWGARR